MAGEFEVYKSVAVGGKSGRQTKQETREQVIARNSFPGPDQNRYIDKFLAEQKKNEQLAESRREFWAADATINNLELKLAYMAEQLANAENKCREMAADNEKAMEAMRQADAAVKLAHEKFSVLAAELRAEKLRQGVSATMIHGSEPETDNTNQQFESLSRCDK